MIWLLKMKLKYCVLIFFLIAAITLAVLYVLLEAVDKHPFRIVKKGAKVSAGNNELTEHVPEYIVEEEQEIIPWSESFRELDDGLWHDFDVDRVRNSVVNSFKEAESENLPFILWWTPFTGDESKIKRCWVGDCYFSQNRSLQHHPQTQAFLFYGTDFSDDDLPLPRKKNHEWGLLHEESPKNNALFYHEDTMVLFNHTSTFKQQSSYSISTQYIDSAEYLLKPQTYTVVEKDHMKIKEGLASILYVQSGCNPPSDRDSYVQELMKYIQIDSSGRCLHNKDLPEEIQNPATMFDKAYYTFLEKYKFIISFENALCDDYMTEKIFRTLHVGAVPIYMGASNLREWLPDSESVLMVDDFNSPKELAERINFLDNNPKEYNKMLEYKKNGLTNEKLNKTLANRLWGINTGRKLSHVTAFECHVCDQIHMNKKLMTEGKAPIEHIATSEHYGCPRPKKLPYDDIPDTDAWMRNAWEYEYDDSKIRAKRLREKVTNSR